MTKILIIDDEESICWGLTQLAQQMGLDADTASSAEQGIERAREQHYDLLILDVRLPGMDGLTAIESFRKILPDSPIITITAFGDLQTAITAIQNGAFEYITKPFELEKARTTIQQALAAKRLAESTEKSADRTPTNNQQLLIGSSPVMQEVFKQIALTTTSESPVLITGESGTGKELTARSIHQFGPRADKPFVAVNIAALSPTLAESELFGHVQGAFTGADSDRKGLLQQADGGTLFLDEIAEIPLEIQVKLLRALDLGEVTPVGSSETIKTDFRLVSATHQDLLSQINHGDFRHDLYYRVRTFQIQLPPLRQRKEDIPLLVDHFLMQSTKEDVRATSEFLDTLLQRSWPGNIRELQSVVERAATLARGGVLTAQHVDEEAATGNLQPSNNNADLDEKIQALIEEWTRQNWNVEGAIGMYDQLISIIDPAILPTAFELSERQYSAAARRLGIHRTTLKKKIDEIGDQT